MRILVTNDDSIYSPGIAALAKAARDFGEVRVVAPDVEQSSMGQAITATRPLWYKKSPVHFEGVEAYKVNGTPSDCVALGTHLWATTDLVLSGINVGYNLGNALWHSGTLAAAKQAVLLGVRGIAVSSTTDSEESDYELLIPFVKKSIEMILDCPTLKLANVNLPKNPKDILWTNQSVRQYDGKIMPGVDPMGRKHYWFTVVPLQEVDEGTDRWAVNKGLGSITPLRLDLTDEMELKKIKAENRSKSIQFS